MDQLKGFFNYKKMIFEGSQSYSFKKIANLAIKKKQTNGDKTF